MRGLPENARMASGSVSMSIVVASSVSQMLTIIPTAAMEALPCRFVRSRRRRPESVEIAAARICGPVDERPPPDPRNHLRAVVGTIGRVKVVPGCCLASVSPITIRNVIAVIP